MRYSRTDLLQLKDCHLEIDEDIIFTDEISKQFQRIRKINDIHVFADGDYDPELQHLDIHFDIKGSVVVGCDVTGEDVEVPIDTESDEIFSFRKEEEDYDIIKAEGDRIRLLPVIFQLIMMEIPMKVVKPGKIKYPKGEGWEIMTEDSYNKEKQSAIDPRLAILKDYKPQDE